MPFSLGFYRMRLFATFNTIPEAPYVLPLGNNEAPKTIKDGLLGTNTIMVVCMDCLGYKHVLAWLPDPMYVIQGASLITNT